MEIQIAPDAQTAAKQAAQTLGQQFEQHKNKSILFLVSAGSALTILDQLDASLLDARVTIGVADERYSRDPNINNFAQISRLGFFKKAKEQNVGIIDTLPTQGEVLEAFADRYEQALKNWRAKHLEGVIIATAGIGLDGHMLGVMPYPRDPEYFRQTFDATDRWVVGYNAVGKNQYPLRATTTLAFARRIDQSIFLVVGQQKREALVRTLAEEGSLAETPARIIHEMQHVFLFTDQNVSV